MEHARTTAARRIGRWPLTLVIAAVMAVILVAASPYLLFAVMALRTHISDARNDRAAEPLRRLPAVTSVSNGNDGSFSGSWSATTVAVDPHATDQQLAAVESGIAAWQQDHRNITVSIEVGNARQDGAVPLTTVRNFGALTSLASSVPGYQAIIADGHSLTDGTRAYLVQEARTPAGCGETGWDFSKMETSSDLQALRVAGCRPRQALAALDALDEAWPRGLPGGTDLDITTTASGWKVTGIIAGGRPADRQAAQKAYAASQHRIQIRIVS